MEFVQRYTRYSTSNGTAPIVLPMGSIHQLSFGYVSERIKMFKSSKAELMNRSSWQLGSGVWKSKLVCAV